MKKNFNKEEYREQKQQETQEILKKLEQGVKDVFASGKFKEYLDVMSKFHNYSFNNSIMIMLQKPDASHVAGYTTWKQLGRQVKKGEKGIKILAPSKYIKEIPLVDKEGKPVLDENGNQKTELKEFQYFKTVNVFDISQTEGKELPSLITTLKGKVEEKQAIYKALEKLTWVEIQEKTINGRAKGYFKPANLLTGEPPQIVVKKGMEDLQSIKTAIHEAAHCLLHDPNKNETESKQARDVQEVQAEAVAYVVSQKLGLDTSDYSFGYIASWSANKQLDELKESLKVIQKTADKIYSVIEQEIGHLKDISSLIKDDIKDKSIVEIVWTESDFFSEGELLTFKEANSKFKESDDIITDLRQEAKEKGEYYPYLKTRFIIKTSIDGKEFNYAGRYDMGDGDGPLINHIKEHSRQLKEHSETVINPKEKEDINKEIDFIDNKLIPKLEKELAKESITKRIEKAKETLSKNSHQKHREKEKESR